MNFRPVPPNIRAAQLAYSRACRNHGSDSEEAQNMSDVVEYMKVKHILDSVLESGIELLSPEEIAGYATRFRNKIRR